MCSEAQPSLFNISRLKLEHAIIYKLLDTGIFLCTFIISENNQLLQLCTARTAWSESDQAVRTVHSCNSWWLALLWSDSVIKLVSVLFGKCTTLVVMKCWPMVIRQWKAEKLGAFWRWPITRYLIKSDSSYLNYRAHCKFCLIRQQSGNIIIWNQAILSFEISLRSHKLMGGKAIQLWLLESSIGVGFCTMDLTSTILQETVCKRKLNHALCGVLKRNFTL